MTKKLVEQEYGRRLYADDQEYADAMRQTSEKYVIDRMGLIKQSEFKKPYAEDDYSGMEYRYTPPDTVPPFAMDNPDQGFNPTLLPDTCKPVILSVDGRYFDCGCKVDCDVDMEISCSPNVGDVVLGGHLFKKSELRFNILEFPNKYPRSDTVNLFVTATGFKPGKEVAFEIKTMTPPPDKKIQPIYNTKTGKKIGEARYSSGLIQGEMKFDCVCDDADPACKSCDACTALSIGYTSQQMSCRQTQNLTAVGGAGCFVWSILSGGGTLTQTDGSAMVEGVSYVSVRYNAPSTNPNCNSNPTIQLKDFCTTTATLKIAINCSSDTENFAVSVHTTENLGCDYVAGWYCCERDMYVYNCAGNILLGPLRANSPYCTNSSICETTPAACAAACTSTTKTGVDLRTTALKLAGCCPKQFLDLELCT